MKIGDVGLNPRKIYIKVSHILNIPSRDIITAKIVYVRYAHRLLLKIKYHNSIGTTTGGPDAPTDKR